MNSSKTLVSFSSTVIARSRKLSEMKNKISSLVVLVFLIHATFTSAADPEEQKKKDRCSTLSCVHASATIIQKLDTDIDPCDDFYEYACGTFIAEQHTPDEKSTVDTLAIMTDKLTEYLLTLLLKPATGEEEKKLHKLAKTLFNSCYNFDRVNERGKEPILNLIKATGQWPILEGKNWDESQFDLKTTILKLRKYISKSDSDIFDSDLETNEVDAANQGFSQEEADFARLENGLKTLIRAVATSLNAADTPELRSEIDEMIEYEKKLDTYMRKFKRYRKLYKPRQYNKSAEFKSFYDQSLYIHLLEPFILANTTEIKDEIIPIEFMVEFQDFIQNAPKRPMANSIFWRIMQVSLPFQDKDLRNIVLTFEKEALGKEDNEQRWIFCADVATLQAPVAIGSLYVSQYFTAEDKKFAVSLVDYILQQYIETIKKSTWMDADTKERALAKTEKMTKYIGYHDNLLGPEAETFYDALPPLNEDHFLEIGLAFKIFNADREFKKLNPGKGKKAGKDWTKYSKPATVNAFYNSKDNSIQFPAAILQTPNFDKDRPAYMNFGAIGSVIGHEITHAFDDQASKLETWSAESVEEYKSRIQCIINQYSSFRVPEIEDYYLLIGDQISEVHLNGNFTQKEDIADCGGLKLSYYAFKRFAEENPEAKILPVGLHEFSQDQIFWMSFAQTFCSVARPPQMKNKIDTDFHSLDKFRVNGALSNMKEFSDSWKCPEGSPMNPKNKCALW